MECASGLDMKTTSGQSASSALLGGPLPALAKTKDEMAQWGYMRRPESRHVQRSIDQRWRRDYQLRVYGPELPRWSGAPRPQTVG